MILQFPDLDTLRLALTSGAVPAGVSLALTAAGFDEQGQVWLQPSVTPGRAALAELRRLRVQTPRSSAVPLTEHFSCWLQAFPLAPEGGRTLPPEQAPVLFGLSADQFAAVATEILRLGNDRQSFRYLEGKDGDRVLLRVVGPPYYTLLRALDRDGDDAPVAYVECAPRAWIQVGHTHPFAPRVKVPDGKVLLLRPPRDWTFLPDAPFREIYEVLEFVLPGARTAWSEGEVGHRLKVPLRLVPGDPAEADELWVLRERPLEQLDELVSNAGDDLLQKLSFAVAEQDGKTGIVLRVRPTRGAPPAPVLDAARFRTYLKLPNLFVPSGKRLHPPLSRHVLRKLLAEDPAVITWLYPNDDGTFTPETLPDEAFRPLSDWIDYVLEHDRQALQTWVQAAQFDFEPFVCDESEAPKPKKPPAAGRDRKGRRQPDVPDDGNEVQTFAAPPEDTAADVPVLPEPARGDLPVVPEQLRALEEQFLALGGPLDSPGRRALWPELARLNLALGHGEDAGLCWMNVLWSADEPDPRALGSWFRAEASKVPAREGPRDARKRSWAAAGAEGRPREVGGGDLDLVLGLAEPLMADVRALAAYVGWAARPGPPPAALGQRLPAVARFLEQHERLLPVRAGWLAWRSLTRLAGGDVLGLARARDRLLERLYQQGLRPAIDLPGFLHFAGQTASDRFRAFRHWLLGLAESARGWIERSGQDVFGAQTGAYADLIFAFGLARLKEGDASRALLARAEAVLGPRDAVHKFLLRAYAYRIGQALQDRPHGGPLPREQLDSLKAITGSADNEDRMRAYLIDKLRSRSRILEPDQRIDPYRLWLARKGDLDRLLAELPDLTDRHEIVTRVEQLLKGKDGQGREGRARVLRAALDLAPRVEQEFALRVLAEAGAVYDALPAANEDVTLFDRAALLEKGMFVAAHFDRPDYVQAFVARFERLLATLRGAGALQGLDSLAEQSFRGLRKLGMGDQIRQLLRRMADLLIEGRGLRSLGALLAQATAEGAANADKTLVEALAALLHVAGSWYYFGETGEAEQVLDAARRLLLGRGLLDQNQYLAPQQTQLACAYVAALAHAPVEVTQSRVEELFARLVVRDTYTTSTHYKLSQLSVVEAVVLAIATDGAALGGEVSRWLDEDEFLIRRRVHRDLREAVGRSGS